MRVLTVISIQNLIYCTYTVVEMLSKHDRIYAKTLLGIVFFYLAFLTANSNGFSTQKSAKITVITLVAFILLQRVFWWISS